MRILTLCALVASVATNAFYILKEPNEQKVFCPTTEQGEKLRSITRDGESITCHYNYNPFSTVEVRSGTVRTHQRNRS